MGHQADLANCYKFNILQQICSTQYCTILFWNWGRKKSQDRFLAMQAILHDCSRSDVQQSVDRGSMQMDLTPYDFFS
jgi:hypothetical protein